MIIKMKAGQSILEEIRHFNEIGQEYWSAREFYTAL